MSSNQTCRCLPISPLSSQVNACWKVQGALQSPCCIVLELYVPWGIENVVLWTSFGSMHICSYASDISILDRYFVLATDSWISHMSGIGVMSRIVFHRSLCTKIHLLCRCTVAGMLARCLQDTTILLSHSDLSWSLVLPAVLQDISGYFPGTFCSGPLVGSSG